MARETMIPLSAVMAIIEQQNEFNRQLVEKLGLHLEKASENYRDALNPPVAEGYDGQMSFNMQNDEAEDLQYQLDSGIIDPTVLTPAMKRLLDGTRVTFDT